MLLVVVFATAAQTIIPLVTLYSTTMRKIVICLILRPRLKKISVIKWKFNVAENGNSKESPSKVKLLSKCT